MQGFNRAHEHCVDTFDSDVCVCKVHRGNHEDVLTGVCLKSFGVFPKDTRDELGREHFLAVAPSNSLVTWYKTPLDFTDRFSFDMHEGPMCCAPEVALFHKIANVEHEYKRLYDSCATCPHPKKTHSKP